MPIYEYECKHCQHHFDALQKISDPKLTECPQCHQNTLEKQVSAAGFQLKGNGWYVTDFKNKEGAKTESKAEKAKATDDN